MGSIVYEMVNSPCFKQIAQHIQEQNKARIVAQEAGILVPRWEGPTRKSFTQYRKHAIQFGNWCRSVYGCKTYEACRPYIQAYADSLRQKGLSPSTIHTYLAGVCCAYGVSLSDLEKPIRHVAENTRSRGSKKSDTRRDTKRECSPRLFDLAACIGIRRTEYGQLRGDDLVRDEVGYWCVRVRKGKGGKQQLQRIPPGKEAFVADYFDGSHNYVFTRAEMENKIDLHHLRHDAAWTAYQGYVERLNAQPWYREQLMNEVKARWDKYCKKRWNPREVQGVYRLRGRNRELAIAAGFPTEYDRLALMVVSIFVLSHWRNDVSVANYLLAAAADMVFEKAKN